MLFEKPQDWGKMASRWVASLGRPPDIVPYFTDDQGTLDINCYSYLATLRGELVLCSFPFSSLCASLQMVPWTVSYELPQNHSRPRFIRELAPFHVR